MEIEKNELTKLLTMDQSVMYLFLEFIADQVIFINNRLELIAHTTLKKKIAYYLLAEYRNTKCNSIYIPYSKRKWAEYLNVQPPSISRTLNEFESKGLIVVNQRNLSIINMSGLVKELS